MRLIDADALNLWEILRSYCSSDVCCDVMDVINNSPTINPYEWIGINDKLPKQFQEILTYHGRFIGNLTNVYTYMGDNKWKDHYGYWNSAEGEGITHWMPLPKLPNLKENNNET